MKHYNIHIKGMVQGVFFRKYTEMKAEELGVKGFVSNRPDGSVYIEAEAEEDVLREFIKWCYAGSPASRVETVVYHTAALSWFTDFAVKRWNEL